MLNKPITIGICAPASCFDREKLGASVEFLRLLGFRTYFSNIIFDKMGYLAGTDEARAHDLNAMFTNKDIDIIMCARGGYGSARIIDHLDLELISANPKTFIGASDTCSLMFFLENNTKCNVLHGPLVTEMRRDMDPESLDFFLRAVHGYVSPYKIRGLKPLAPGSAKACVTGGNLTIIQSSIKTSHEIATDGKILFIEDVGEKLYRLDRTLTHLKNASKFERIKGVISGEFANSEFSSEQLETLLIDVFGRYNIPIVSGFPAGHGEKKIIIPFNMEITLNANAGEVDY